MTIPSLISSLNTTSFKNDTNRLFKALLLISTLAFTAGCNSGDQPLSSEPRGLKIHIVNDHNEPFGAQVLRWWYVGERDIKHALICHQEACSTWLTNAGISGSIVIHAYSSIAKEDDPECWKIYTGEAHVEMPTQESTVITMKYTNTVCS